MLREGFSLVAEHFQKVAHPQVSDELGSGRVFD